MHLQFILDRIRARLAGWKGKLMNMAGRRVLVRCVLTALPIFALTALRAPKKTMKEVDKARRRFLWAPDDDLTGARCKVGWSKVCSPTDKDGLGLHDMQRFSRALRLRWLWLQWQQPQRPWHDFPVPCDEADRRLFASATTVTIGDGNTARFWTSSWLGSAPLCDSFPALFKHTRRKNRSVAEALADDKWVTDLRHGNTLLLLPDFLQLWRQINSSGVVLHEQQADTIRWTKSSNGIYSANSAYRMQFDSSSSTGLKSIVWKAWAPPKIKIFSWLAHQDRLWCSDRL